MKNLSPPPTRVDNVTEILHGVPITDPYRWLEDQNSPETRAWLDEQIAYTHRIMASIPGRDEIRDRLAELMMVDSISTPMCRGGWYFYSRRLPQEQQYTIYRRSISGGPEETLVDPHPMSADCTTSVTFMDVSSNGSLIAYGVRQGGADEVEVRVRRTDTGQDLPDTLPPGRYYTVKLAADGSALYYSIGDDHGPRVLVHRFGTERETDELVFGKGLGPEKIVGIGLSEDGRYLLLTVYHGSAGTKTEIHVADLTAGTSAGPIVDSIEARFSAHIAEDQVYLLTNWNAPNGRLFSLSVDAAPNSTDTWREVIPETPDAILLGAAPVGGKLIQNYLKDASSLLMLSETDGSARRDIKLPGIGSTFGFLGQWSSRKVHFGFSSFAAPTTVFEFDTSSLELTAWAEASVPLDCDSFVVRQEWYRSKDGTRVPMFLLHRKNLDIDGERPVYLTGYGGFNSSKTPAFSALAALWAERGGIYAVPSLRGGGEYGEEWHKAGMLQNKQNVFDDFCSAAQWLIDAGCTNPKRIAIDGRSNGGLLVGAAVTQAPEMFGAVVCGYPLLDMIRYHRFLVAGFWVPEYGSSDDAEQFKYLLAYSPYHNVHNGVKYPPIMFVTGDSDTRVAPLHARKMAALMQAATGSQSPVLLHYDVKSGHSEGKPIGLDIEDTADEIAFLLDNV